MPQHNWYPRIKSIGDRLAALILLVPGLPVMLIAALCIRLTSRGPVLYTQTRVGRGGRHFRLYKLRTMVSNAEALTGPVWSSGADDPRVTRVGRTLRNTHVDELPQLLNVVLGQMSLIGPRPERPEMVDRIELELPLYTQRLRVRPGVTGLAQLKLPPDCDIESVRKKLLHDLYYVRNCSLGLDLRIALSTSGYLVAAIFRSLWRLVELPSREAVSRDIEAVVDPASALFIERSSAR